MKDAKLLANAMRITTWNVNGMRAAIRKGIERFVLDLDPDVLLLQEVVMEMYTVVRRRLSGWKVYRRTKCARI